MSGTRAAKSMTARSPRAARGAHAVGNPRGSDIAVRAGRDKEARFGVMFKKLPAFSPPDAQPIARAASSRRQTSGMPAMTSAIRRAQSTCAVTGPSTKSPRRTSALSARAATAGTRSSARICRTCAR